MDPPVGFLALLGNLDITVPRRVSVNMGHVIPRAEFVSATQGINYVSVWASFWEQTLTNLTYDHHHCNVLEMTVMRQIMLPASLSTINS